MICPVCHLKDTRISIDLIEKSDNDKAWRCHVCGSYVCLDCGAEMVSDPPLINYPYKGRIERLHRCDCGNKVYLVVQED